MKKAMQASELTREEMDMLELVRRLPPEYAKKVRLYAQTLLEIFRERMGE